MNICCNANNVYTEGTLAGNLLYVEINIDGSEADEVFGYIEKHVDHGTMMACLSESEVREYFNIKEEE